MILLKYCKINVEKFYYQKTFVWMILVTAHFVTLHYQVGSIKVKSLDTISQPTDTVRPSTGEKYLEQRT
jgi:hypothetical protein